MELETAERIAGLEMQIKLFKWAIGGFCVLTMAVSGSLAKWVYGQGSDVNVLKNDLKTQRRTVATHEKKMEAGNRHVEKMSKDIQANTIHLENIKEMVWEIRGILKSKR